MNRKWTVINTLLPWNAFKLIDENCLITIYRKLSQIIMRTNVNQFLMDCVCSLQPKVLETQITKIQFTFTSLLKKNARELRCSNTLICRFCLHLYSKISLLTANGKEYALCTNRHIAKIEQT